MASIVLDKLKQPVFNLFYIMTEGVQVEAGFAAYRKTVFLLFVDVLQVIRVMCSLRYGWTEETQGMVQKTDIVYMFTSLVSKLIPRYSFFILAAVLVLVALMDSYYVVQLFKAGNVQKLWPVKLLRFLVASLVTILFSSVIKWLLIPVECLVSEEKSFSEFVHDEEARCTPWGMPEIMISIPTILLASAYILFALGTSYLAFEINPLSRNPRAMHTGRVELLFAFNKVAVTLLVYLSDLVTPVVISLIFFFWTTHVFRQHIKLLPFHSAVTNNVRGGIYGMVLWFSFATIIVASIKTARKDEWDAAEHPAWLQPLQWSLAGAVPLAFLLGLSLTALMQFRVGRSLKRLRGDFEHTPDGASSDDGKARFDRIGSCSTDTPLPGAAHVPRGVKRGVFEKFFDTEWESRRRFAHEWRAGVLLRHLLHNRNIHDLGFMQYLVGKAIQEHPESTLLQLQLLVLHRFVFRDSGEANEVQRALKLDQKTLPIDFQYVIFVAERKSNQALRGTDIGGGAVTGIRLMEFDISFERARKAHLASISKLRSFWRHVEKKRNTSFDTSQATDLVKDLDEYEEQKSIAKKEYEILNEKYPQSVQLLRSYAHFCDTVLNDFRQSEMCQKNAAILEGDDELEEEEEEEGSREFGGKEMLAEKEGGGSTYSSEAEPYRVSMQRYLEAQSEHMMGREATAVHKLHQRVGLALLLLLIIATAGFVLNDNYLFSGLALHNMDQIDKTGLLRSYALNTAFLLRSLQLSAIYNDTAAYERDHVEIVDMMETWRERHRENYESMQNKLKKYYLDSEIVSYVPVEGLWQRHTDNFWSSANEFARRSERAAHTPAEQMRTESFRLGAMSYEKENVAYVFENLERETRQTLRVVVDIFEGEMEQFGVLATALVICNVTVNALLVLLIAFFVLRALVREMRDMQSALVFCSLALALPRSTANAVYKYYDTVELNMKIMEDEEAERNAVIANDNGTFTTKPRGSGTAGLGSDGLPGALVRRPSTEESGLVSFEGNVAMQCSPSKVGRRPSESIMRPRSQEPAVQEEEPAAVVLSRVFMKELGGSEGSGGSESDGAGRHVSSTVELREKADARETSEGGRDAKKDKAQESEGESGDARGEEGERLGERKEGASQEGKEEEEEEEKKEKKEKKEGGEEEQKEGGGEEAVVQAGAGESEGEDAEQGRGVWGKGALHAAPDLCPVGLPLAILGLGRDVKDQEAGKKTHADVRSALFEGRIKRPSEDGWSRRSSGNKKSSDEEPSGRGGKGRGGSAPSEDKTGRRGSDGGRSSPGEETKGRRGESTSASESSEEEEERRRRRGEAWPGDKKLRARQEVEGEKLRARQEVEGEKLRARRVSSPGADALSRRRSDKGEERVQRRSSVTLQEEAVEWEMMATAVLGAERTRVRDNIRKRKQLDRDHPFQDPAQARRRRERHQDQESAPHKPSWFRNMLFGATKPAIKDAGAAVDGVDGRPEKFMEESRESLRKVVHQRQPWHTRVEVYLAVCVCVLALCIFSMVYPSRNIDDLVNLAPTANQAGRRRSLASSCVHYARELVLDDGLSRMTKEELAGALRFYMDELRDADDAVRLGGSKGVRVGSDYRNEYHNEVMYGNGCLWREDPTDCSSPDMDGRHDVSEHGLQYLLKSFEDAVEKVLARYAPGMGENREWLEHRPEVATADMFASVHTVDARVALLTSDPDLKFIMAAFNGDVTMGLGEMLTIFHEETAHVLQTAQSELQLLFGLYVSAVGLLFYTLLFRRTIRLALCEVYRARGLVMAMPTHVLKKESVHAIVAYFTPADQFANKDEEDGVDASHENADPALEVAQQQLVTPVTPPPAPVATQVRVAPPSKAQANTLSKAKLNLRAKGKAWGKV